MGDKVQGVQRGEDLSRSLSDWFYNWELRGRGWRTWSYAVDIEPPFRPLDSDPLRGNAADSPREEPKASPARPSTDFRHIPLLMPHERKSPTDRGLLNTRVLGRLNHMLAFELFRRGGDALRATVTVCSEDIAAFEEHLPESSNPSVAPGDGIAQVLNTASTAVSLIDLGLEREFLVSVPPLLPGELPPLDRAGAAMAKLAKDEAAIVQILVKPVRENWSLEMLRAALGPSDAGLFVDDLVTPCRDKIGAPLLAVIARVAGFANTQARAAQIAHEMAATLARSKPEDANALIALPESGLDRGTILNDIKARVSHRSGMILNISELARLIPLSDVEDRSAKPSAREKIFSQPTIMRDGVALGEDLDDLAHAQLHVSVSDRLRHMSVIGEPCRAKTNLLAELVLHDLDERYGVGIIDCDGSLVDLLLRRLPRHRLGDVTLIDPENAPVPFDLLRADTIKERSVLDGDLIAVLSGLADGWDAQTSAVFADTVAALRSQDDVPTLLDVRRVIAAQPRSKPGNVLLTALDSLLENKCAHAVLAGNGQKLDIDRLLGGGVLLARLPVEALGRQQSTALAGMLLARFHNAMIRSTNAAGLEHPPFFLYLHAIEQGVAGAAASLPSIARTGGAGLVIDSGPSEDAVPRGQPAHISAKFHAESRNAEVQIGQARYTVAIPDFPIEPRDAAQRMRDVVSVTARRYGLTDRAAVMFKEMRNYPKIPRLTFSP